MIRAKFPIVFPRVGLTAAAPTAETVSVAEAATFSPAGFHRRKYTSRPAQWHLPRPRKENEAAFAVDAFIWIWQACGENALASVVGLPGIKQLGNAWYRPISRFRYRLGKNESVCDFHCAKEI